MDSTAPTHTEGIKTGRYIFPLITKMQQYASQGAGLHNVTTYTAEHNPQSLRVPRSLIFYDLASQVRLLLVDLLADMAYETADFAEMHHVLLTGRSFCTALLLYCPRSGIRKRI